MGSKIRRIIMCVIILGNIFCFQSDVLAQEQPLSSETSTEFDENSMIEKTWKNLKTEELDTFLEEINEEYDIMPSFDIGEMIKNIATGQIDFDIQNIFKTIIHFLFKEVVSNFNVLGKILILAVVCAILQNLQASFEKSSVGKVAYTVCYLLLIALALSSFNVAVKVAKEAVDNMVGFMLALIPVLLTILTSMGGLTSAALFHPIIYLMVNVFGTIVQNVVFPLLFMTTILILVNNISDDFKVSGLAGLVKQITLGILGICLTIFIGVLGIQGVAGAVGDGVSLRTAKFLSKNFIPIVGHMFADSVDVVIGCSLLLKNALGVIGTMAIIIICLFPVIKIISLFLMYKLAGALIQPVGDARLVNCLNGMGNCLLMVFAAVATVGLMFFIALTILVGAGNITVMMH